VPAIDRLRVAVLISGGGTTLRNLVAQIEQGRLDAEIPLVISSNPAAPGLEFARQRGLRTALFSRGEFHSTASFSSAIFDACRAVEPHVVALAGFLKLLRIPPDFINRVMNIHPALIPAFCGRGYYGMHVHQAVLDYGAKISGCTVHFVDDEYDHGPIILQKAVPVLEEDTPETLAARVFAAECEAYPEALRLFAAGRLTVRGRRVHILPA
jgi:formyltetrahydrofolate-dependent phosphoribosylglycinamide formyltransferase